jgi:hypothetical protein
MNKQEIQNWANELYKNNPQISSTNIINIRPEHDPYSFKKNVRATVYLVGHRDHVLDEIVEGENVTIKFIPVEKETAESLSYIETFLRQHGGNFDLSIAFRNSIELYNGEPRLEYGIILVAKLMR